MATQTKAVPTFTDRVRAYVDAVQRIRALRGPESLASIRRRVAVLFGPEVDLRAERLRLLTDPKTPQAILDAYSRLEGVYRRGIVRRLMDPGGDRFEARLLNLPNLVGLRERLAIALTSAGVTIERLYGATVWYLLETEPSVFVTGDIEDPDAARAEADALEATLPALRAACVPSAEDWSLVEVLGGDGHRYSAAFYKLGGNIFPLAALDDALAWCVDHREVLS